MTASNTILIREAGPQDAPFLARVMLLSARSHIEDRPGFWEKALGGTEAGCCAYLEQMALVDDRCPTHWTHFLIAEVDGRSAAALAGYDPRTDGGSFGNAAMTKADKNLGRRNTRVTVACRHAFDTLAKCAWPENFVPDAWIIEYVATLPEFRNNGSMKALLKETLVRGRAKGCSSARVHVFIDNTPAERVYSAAGFTVAGEKRDRAFELFFGTPGMKLLERSLLVSG